MLQFCDQTCFFAATCYNLKANDSFSIVIIVNKRKEKYINFNTRGGYNSL